MQDCVEVTGIVLKAEPVGEYDKRVILLTKERGKITAFAKGARRQNSRFLAPAGPFSFGRFELFAGRTAYTIRDVSISNYFEGLRKDFEGICYGMYFLELCDYCAQENNDEKEMLKLLYQALRALTAQAFDRRLVRAVFELKLIVINGEFPGIREGKYQDSTRYAVGFIEQTPVERLYTFTVTQDVLSELSEIAGVCRKEFLPGRFHSLEILNSL